MFQCVWISPKFIFSIALNLQIYYFFLHCAFSQENTQLSNADRNYLHLQVCFLLREVEESRGGGSVNASGDFSSTMETELASSQIISKKLVTFRDIEELQENNQKLLSIVRTLSSRQEEIERATDEINTGEMKEKLDRWGSPIPY